MKILSSNPRKVRVSQAEVQLFRQGWPCNNLRDRSYWFEFDAKGDLVDTNVSERDDGPGASSLAEDAKAFLLQAQE